MFADLQPILDSGIPLPSLIRTSGKPLGVFSSKGNVIKLSNDLEASSIKELRVYIHELMHSTGIPLRRVFRGRYDPMYSLEEIIAETATLVILKKLGLMNDILFQDGVRYLNNYYCNCKYLYQYPWFQIEQAARYYTLKNISFVEEISYIKNKLLEEGIR